MKRTSLLFLKLMASVFPLGIAATASAQTDNIAAAKTSNRGTYYYSDPAISPDASEIAFVSGGDIWTVSAKGGEARLLISHPDYESRPVYSPDGRYIAFNSTRSGNGDIYVLNIASGQLTRLTFDDAFDDLNAFSRDGKYIYFSTSSREIAGMRDVYRVRVDGGTPMPVSENRYLSEFFPMPSPDGKTLALTARGVASGQWWRKGHSHLDESEIWLMHEGKTTTYTKVTEGGAKELWPMWSTDGKSLYYVSDKNGAQNLYVRPIGGAAKMLTQFGKGMVLFPSLAANGQTIVFEKDFKVWKFDVATGQSQAVAITRKGVPAGPGVEHVRLSNLFRELALSPDGKKIAFVAHGEVFVASAKDGGDAVRVTNTGANEGQITWAPNSNALVYVSDRDGVAHLYQYNFLTSTETRLTNDKEDDGSPLFSNDGKTLAFVRNGQELRAFDIASKKEKLLTKGFFDRPPFSSSNAMSWSPDNKFIAFAGYGAKSFQNIYVVSANSGEARPVTFLANGNSGSVNWSRDGKYLLFNTGQRTEEAVVARVDLVLQRPRFREDQFQQMFTDQVQTTTTPNTPATPRPSTEKANRAADSMFKPSAKTTKPAETTSIVYEGLRQRLNLLPLGVDVNDIAVSKDGNTLLITASAAGQVNLFTYSLDELSREPAVVKQLTSTPGFKSNAQFSPDGKEVYFLEQGRIQSISVDSRAPKPIAVTAELDIDFNKEKVEVFKQAWQVQNKGFYDPNFHGADWNAVKATYEPLAEGASTPDELRRLLSLMVGELNASHSGVSGPPSGGSTTGRLGLRFDAAEYENGGRLKVTEVITLGPAAVTGDVQVGDYITAVDGIKVTSATNLDQLLENKINKRVVLTVDAGNDTKKVTVRPVNQTTEKGLLYRQWVQQQRDYVAKVSGGKLGYVHMYDMSAQSLNQLYLDVDAENHSREGVVVDVRNNNGGFVNAYALDVLSRKGYMSMAVRGLPTAPARTQLGQRALDAPTILVTNQHSLSDAEDFTEGYRTLKLGKVVGEPTGGWIIYTSSATLIDGTTVRLPFIKVTDHEGKNMELNPRPVDIFVSKPLGETNKDSQLDAAVKELLQQLNSAKATK
jgi:tricorn protease